MDDLNKNTDTTEKAEEQQAKDAQSRKARRRRRVRRQLMTIIMLAILTVVAFFAVLLVSTKASDSPVGYWIIKEGTSGGVTMSQEDAEALGLNEVGSMRLDKSGDCEVTILGEESKGKWTAGDDGTITIDCGEEKTFTATIDEEGVMTAKDDTMMVEYKLEK